MNEFVDKVDSQLSKAILDTMREPLVVLDDDLCVIIANPAFYEKFGTKPEDTEGKLFYTLGSGQWDVPQLRTLLDLLIPNKMQIENYEIRHDFPHLGPSIVLVNAREIKYQDGNKKILLSIQDITEQTRLMRQKDTLLREMRHRIANSLQMIASILILKAADVQSEESRLHLQEAHDRIISIATVQRNLDPTGESHKVEVAGYLTTLCKSLAKSMIGGRKPITLNVTGTKGTMTPDEAIALGLITTELVINSLKHAFPTNEGLIDVKFVSNRAKWKLQVSDDGVGLPKTRTPKRDGLGTSILDSLADQLSAKIEKESSSKGTTVSISSAANRKSPN